MIDSKKVIVALDGMTEKEALGFAKLLQGKVWGFKINDLLHEAEIIGKLKKYGRVFADAKLHDIPNTVANSVKRLSAQGADIITIHAGGGLEMMKSAKKNCGRSKIIAVTVLTSDTLHSQNKVLKLVKEAVEAGVDGIVCSGHELKAVLKLPGMKSKLKIVPGIRPEWYKTKDDQKRKMTPKDALALGADFLVIGRPLTSAKNILKALSDL